MALVSKSTATILGLLALGVGGYEVYKHTGPASRRASTGDTAVVDGTKLVGVALPAGIPAGVTSLVVTLGAETSGVFAANVVGYVVNNAPVSIPLAAAVNVPRTAITGIVTNNVIAA